MAPAPRTMRAGCWVVFQGLRHAGRREQEEAVLVIRLCQRVCDSAEEENNG